MRTLIQAMLVLAATAALFACKPKEEPPAPVASVDEETAPTEEVAAVAVDTEAQTEACDLTITAPQAVEVTTYWNKTGGAASQVRSIHWASTAEKDAMPTNSPAVPLEITCSSADSPNITIALSAVTSTEDDVPMTPGSYPIVGQLQPTAKSGEFALRQLIYDGRSFTSRSGTLAISRFGADGVEGSITIDGVEAKEGGGQAIHIEGTFDIPCHGGSYESECRTN